MDGKTIADLVHDDIVDLSFGMGFCSENQDLNRQFFEAVHLIVWKALSEQGRKQQRRSIRQLADQLACERERWMRKVQKVSLS